MTISAGLQYILLKKRRHGQTPATGIFITLLNDIDRESVDCVVVGHGVSASPDQTS